MCKGVIVLVFFYATSHSGQIQACNIDAIVQVSTWKIHQNRPEEKLQPTSLKRRGGGMFEIEH